jgi:hypothetical protein
MSRSSSNPGLSDMPRRLQELEVQRGLKQVIHGKYFLSIAHPTLLTPN